MQELYIRAASFADIREISELAAAEGFRILISDGYRTVNAKSLMSIFSLTVDRPLLLQLSCSESECEAFRRKAARFLAK